MCGPCSECLACEAVCEPKAIRHDEHERFEQLEVGAVIWADYTDPFSLGFRPDDHAASVDGAMSGGDWGRCQDNGDGHPGFYRVDPDDPLAGSAAAARAMLELFGERRHAGRQEPMVSAAGTATNRSLYLPMQRPDLGHREYGLT